MVFPGFYLLFSYSGIDKAEKTIYIGKVIIISCDSGYMIPYPRFLVCLQAIQKLICPILLNILCEAVGFHFLQNSQPTFFRTFPASTKTFFERALPVLTPVLIMTVTRITSVTCLILAAQTTSKATSGNSKFSFHTSTPLLSSSGFRKEISEGNPQSIADSLDGINAELTVPGFRCFDGGVSHAADFSQFAER